MQKEIGNKEDFYLNGVSLKRYRTLAGQVTVRRTVSRPENKDALFCLSTRVESSRESPFNTQSVDSSDIEGEAWRFLTRLVVI